MGQIPNLEKLMAFCWLRLPSLLHIDKRAVSLQWQGCFLEVVNRIGAGKFSLYLQGSSYHTLISRVVRSSFLCRCRGVPHGGGLYRLCGILIDEMAEK